MSNQFTLTVQKEQPVLSIRITTSVTNLPQEIGKAYEAIGAYLEEIGEAPADAPFTAYYNMDMDNLDVEMGYPVSKIIPGKDEIKASSIPACKQVSCMYKGPYMQMGPSYEAMTDWVKEQGLEPTGICYEFYYNSPDEVPEDELLTKILFLLK